MSDAAFNAHWGGWRYPFWISILLVGVSIYIRMKMSESPIFSKLKSEGKTSTNPLKESFRHKANFKMVLLALFGAVMGTRSSLVHRTVLCAKFFGNKMLFRI